MSPAGLQGTILSQKNLSERSNASKAAFTKEISIFENMFCFPYGNYSGGEAELIR